MNREILFRGRRCDSGSWHEGMPVRASEPPYRICAIDIPGKRTCVQIDPVTCCEYTGLTDKNGRRTFEGDKCVVTRVGVLAYGVITFCQGCFTFKENSTGNLLRLCDVEINGYEIRVRGNIYDNPELLRGGLK